MKKLYLIIAGIILTVISVILIIIFVSDPGYYEKKYVYVYNYDHRTRLDFGKYNIYDLPEQEDDRLVESMTFKVVSGEDFYDVIKDHELYDSSLDFKRDGYLAYGYIWIDLSLFHYEIKDNVVVLRASFGHAKISIDYYIHEKKYDKLTNSFVPGPFNNLIKEGETIEDTDYSLPRDNNSFEEVKKIYEANDNSFYEIHDDYILTKAKYFDADNNLQETNDYYCKISNDNGKARIYLLND